MAKYLDPKRIEEILEDAAGFDTSGASRRIVGLADVKDLAELISKELGSVPAVVPMFAVVNVLVDGSTWRPTLNSIDELSVAELDWFENLPDPVKALMEKMEVDEVAVVQGTFNLFDGEWNTPTLIKRVA